MTSLSVPSNTELMAAESVSTPKILNAVVIVIGREAQYFQTINEPVANKWKESNQLEMHK